MDVGDIQMGAKPEISRVTASPQRPGRGDTLTLSVEASHPLGQALTYRWETRTGRWFWESIGDTSQVETAAPGTPLTAMYRVVVSDGFFETSRNVSVTPANLPPEVLSVEAGAAQVSAGGEINFTAVASDPDGDELQYRWSSSPCCWYPRARSTGTITWRPPWTPEDRDYTIGVRAGDGALYDRAELQLRVTGRPDPTVSLAIQPAEGALPLEVTFEAMAQDPAGQIVGYRWLVQKQSSYSSRYFFSWRRFQSSENTTVQTIDRPGRYRVRVQATNDIGRRVSSDWIDITVLAPPTVELTSNVQEGTAPLELVFTAAARDLDGQLVSYAWDFDGDGTVDQTTESNRVAHTFREGGDYETSVTVLDDQGLTGTSTTSVTAIPPIPISVSLETGRTEGPAPLVVDFTARVAELPPGQSAEYQWDFDGDGIADRTSADGAIQHTYNEAGEFLAKVSVSDEEGRAGAAEVEIHVTAKPKVPPVVALTVVPIEGVVPLMVVFTAEASDPDGAVVEYRWDFDGDGTVDRTTMNNTVTHTYDSAGDIPAEVTVVDDDGLTASAGVKVGACVPSPVTPGSSPPNRIIGAVTIDGVQAPDGTVIRAVVGCDLPAQTTTTGGQYAMNVGQATGKSYGQKTITFLVGDRLAAETTVWEFGGVTLLNLTVTTGK